MTDPQLNEKIARMMGWIHDARGWYHAGKDLSCRVAPNFLAPERIHELLDLADEVLPTWALGHDKDARMHIAKTERQFCIEESRSKAIARAIVAYMEAKQETV